MGKTVNKKTGTKLFVINGHFIAGINHTNIEQRRLDAAMHFANVIATKNVENSPVIMFGDLNGGLTSKDVLYLISNRNAFSDMVCHDNFVKLYTPDRWLIDSNGSANGFTVTSTIDYVLTSNDLHFNNPKKTQRRGEIDSKVYYASDHSAISEKVCQGNLSHLIPTLNYLLLDSQ